MTTEMWGIVENVAALSVFYSMVGVLVGRRLIFPTRKLAALGFLVSFVLFGVATSKVPKPVVEAKAPAVEGNAFETAKAEKEISATKVGCEIVVEADRYAAQFKEMSQGLCDDTDGMLTKVDTIYEADEFGRTLTVMMTFSDKGFEGFRARKAHFVTLGRRFAASAEKTNLVTSARLQMLKPDGVSHLLVCAPEQCRDYTGSKPVTIR
jgi:hypothetical protein